MPLSASVIARELEKVKTQIARAKSSPNDIKWTPLPGPQTQAIESLADILLFGGAAGGSKSETLLAVAIKHHRRSIIFRREYPQLKALEDRAKQIVGNLGEYNQTTRVFRLPGNRQLEFGAVEQSIDVQKFQGRPHDFIGIDEAAQMQEVMVRFLFGWLRTSHKGQRCRVIMASNPPMTVEGTWLVSFFAPWLDPLHPNPALPGELRWFTTVEGKDREVESGEPFMLGDECITPLSRTFIPARLADNPYLNETGYRAALQGLPEPLRSQLLYGSFAESTGDDEWQVIPTAWVVAAQARWEAVEKPLTPMTTMGVDVARGGKDRTVITPRFGNWIGEQRVYPGSSTPDGQTILGLILKERQGNAVVNIDVIGVGSSVYDQCKDTMPARPMNASEKSVATDKSGQHGFVNQRAEWWWLAREMLDPESGEEIALPPGRALLADLCAPRWKMRANGIQIESKQEIIKRIGRSPDLGDSCVYALSIQRFEGFGLYEFYRQEAEAVGAAPATTSTFQRHTYT